MSLKNVVLVLFCLPLIPASGNTNVIINPGFENGIEGWAARGCQIALSDTLRRSGSPCVKVSGRDASWQGLKQSIYGKLVEGKIYQISAWVAIDNTVQAPVAISIEQQDDSGTQYHNVIRKTVFEGGWILISGNFTLKVNGELSVLDIYFDGPPAGVAFYVDEVSVYGPEVKTEEVKPAEPNGTGIIDTGARRQKIEGIGGSCTFYMKELATHQDKEKIYDLLFKDLAIDILRIRNTYDINVSDFNNTAILVKDSKEVLGPNLKIMLSSFSPPAQLKSNGSLIKGTLAKKEGKFMYDDFAKWWYESLKAFEKAGVKADYITTQNEPDSEAKYESCIFSPCEDVNVAGYDKAFKAVWEKLNVETDFPKPKFLAPETTGFSNIKNYIKNVNDLSIVYGYAHHLYDCSGCPEAPDRFIPRMSDFKEINAQHGNKPVFQTEFENEHQNWNDAMQTAVLMHNSLAIEEVAGYLYGSLFSTTNRSLVKFRGRKVYFTRPVYYAFKNYSAFIDSGWQRVEASTNNNSVRISAYISPDNNKLTAVLINTDEKTDITLDLTFKDFKIVKGEIYRSSKTENCVSAGSYSGGDSLKLPAYSITTLSLEKQ